MINFKIVYLYKSILKNTATVASCHQAYNNNDAYFIELNEKSGWNNNILLFAQ